jgi:hypothetical protein
MLTVVWVVFVFWLKGCRKTGWLSLKKSGQDEYADKLVELLVGLLQVGLCVLSSKQRKAKLNWTELN